MSLGRNIQIKLCLCWDWSENSDSWAWSPLSVVQGEAPGMSRAGFPFLYGVSSPQGDVGTQDLQRVSPADGYTPCTSRYSEKENPNKGKKKKLFWKLTKQPLFWMLEHIPTSLVLGILHCKLLWQQSLKVPWTNIHHMAGELFLKECKPESVL